jgi:hypothetical protein
MNHAAPPRSRLHAGNHKSNGAPDCTGGMNPAPLALLRRTAAALTGKRASLAFKINPLQINHLHPVLNLDRSHARTPAFSVF